MYRSLPIRKPFLKLYNVFTFLKCIKVFFYRRCGIVKELWLKTVKFYKWSADRKVEHFYMEFIVGISCMNGEASTSKHTASLQRSILRASGNPINIRKSWEEISSQSRDGKSWPTLFVGEHHTTYHARWWKADGISLFYIHRVQISFSDWIDYELYIPFLMWGHLSDS